MGRVRKSRPDSEKYKNIDPETLYVENLPKGIADDEFKKIFSDLATPIRISLNKEKSYAFVQFENSKITSSVLELVRKKYPELDFKPAVYDHKAKKNKKLVSESKQEDTTYTERFIFLPMNSSRSQPNAGSQGLQARSIAEERMMIMKALETVYKKRILKEVDYCTRCGTVATKKCSRCGVFYCSRECQESDWDMHVEICMGNGIFEGSHIPRQRNFSLQQPASRHDFITSDSKPNTCNGFNKEHESERRGDRKRHDGDLEGKSGNDKFGRNEDRKKSYEDRDDRKKSRDDRDDRKKYDDNGDRPRNRGRHDDSDKENFGSRRDSRNDNRASREPRPERFDNKRDFYEPDDSWGSPKDTKSNMEEKQNPSKVQESSDRRSPPPVKIEEKKREFVEDKKEPEKPKAQAKPIQTLQVIGLVRESKDSYWVLECDDLDSWQKLQNSLQDVCEKAPPVKPEIGLICGCFYDDMWYRGKIVAVQPELTVHYIDYGNTSACETNIKKLPDDLSQADGLAFLIKFDKGTPAKYETNTMDGETLSVQVVKEIDNFYLIRFAGEDYPPAEAEEIKEEKKDPPKKRLSALAALSKHKRRNIWDNVKEKSFGILLITSGIGRTFYGCLVPEADEEAVTCFDKVGDLTIPKQPGISAKVGDFILASDGKELAGRGEVLCKAGESYIVNLVDYGQCVKNKDVHSLPDDVKNFPEIGVKVHIEEVFLDSFKVEYVQKEETYIFETTGPCEDNKWPCLLKTEDGKKAASGFIEKWNPPVVQLSYMPIESGSLVLLSSLISLRTAYVRPASKECDDQLEIISSRVKKYSSSAKKCIEPPSVGQMVCARFEEDGEYYRAVVEAVKGNLFNVRFVDYGNDQLTKLDDLLPIPKELQEYPCFATKVQLKNIEKDADCTEVARYYSRLNSESTDLIMKYDGKEVILTEKATGVVVNDFAKEKIAASRK